MRWLYRGARMWMEEDLGTRINANRTAEAVARGDSPARTVIDVVRGQVTDVLGVRATDDVEVDVRDTRAPGVTASPIADAEVGADCKAPVPEVVATTEDLCSAVTLTQDPPAGTRVAAGTHSR